MAGLLSRPVLYRPLYRKKIKRLLMLYNPYSDKTMMFMNDRFTPLLRMVDGKRTVKEILSDAAKMGFADAETLWFMDDLKGHDIIDMSGKGMIEFRETPAPVKTLGVWVHLTNQCNFRCTYCFVHKTSVRMEEPVFRKVVSELFAVKKKFGYGKLFINIAGGEPLLEIQSLKIMIDMIRQEYPLRKDVHINLMTNGSLMTEDLAGYLVDKKVTVSVSLDGPEHENDLTRRLADGTGTFKYIQKGIDILLKHRLLEVLSITVTPANAEGLPQLTRFCMDRNISMNVQFYKKLNRYCGVKAPEDYRDLIKAFRRTLKIIYAYYKKNGITETPLTRHNLLSLHYPRGFKHLSANNCGAGDNYFTVYPDGSFGICPAASLRLATIEDGGIARARKLALPLRQRSSVGRISGCSACPWKYMCAGGCMLERKFNNVPGSKCLLYKAIIPMMLDFEAQRVIEATLRSFSK